MDGVKKMVSTLFSPGKPCQSCEFGSISMTTIVIANNIIKLKRGIA